MKRLKYKEERDSVCISPFVARGMASFIARFPEEIPGFREGTILEVGTGKGTYSNACLEQGLDVYAIDIRHPRDIPEFNGNPERLVQADAECLPFKKGSFNLVIENLFFDDLLGLQDFHYDLSGLVREIHRVLKNPGFLFTSNREYRVLQSRLFSEEKVYETDWTVYRKI